MQEGTRTRGARLGARKEEEEEKEKQNKKRKTSAA
jgi:hypothetical protein